MKPRMLTILLTVFQLSVFSSVTSAQSLRNADEPAEFPPSSFQGKQYVDSRGCVYVRAGIDGNVTWVPRVGRNRKQVCGYQPTVIAGAPARPATSDKNVVQIIPAPAATPAPVVVLAPATVPTKAIAKTAQARPVAPRVVAPKPVARLPKPVVRPVVVQAQPAPRPASSATTACANRTPYSGDYQDVTANALPVRCGPQTQKPHDFVIISSENAARPAQGNVAVVQTHRVASAVTVAPVITAHTRVAPRHVYEQQRAAADVGKVPPGYKRAWSDGRLNQHRAHQTLAGKAKMDQIWTQTVPRRLIVRPAEPARVVTAPVVVARKTRVIVTAPVLSSKGVRKPARPGGAASYVQVATFADANNATRTARRIAAMGLPVARSAMARAGTSYQIILAGPFTSSQEAAQALQSVRRAGFRDAFARR